MDHQQHNHGGHPPHLPPADDGNKITPELLVDALSGHEDGLLSIAERLMTHYDSGYDASEFKGTGRLNSNKNVTAGTNAIFCFGNHYYFQWARRSSTRSPTCRSCSSTWSRCV